MELKCPPPLLFFISLFLISNLPHAEQVSLIWQFVALLTALFSLIFALLSMITFHHYRTSFHPQHLERTEKLITTGIYRISRNPMYIALISGLSAYSLWLGCYWGCLIIAIFIKLITVWQIIPEECFLAEKFGESYRIYQQNVPRWLY